MDRTRQLSLFYILCLLFCGGLFPSWAGEPKASGTLSSSTAAVGEAVTYTLTIEGEFESDKAPVPQVDGLEVRGSNYSSQLMIVNFDATRRVTISYRLVPLREGTFTIPPLEVTVEGKKLKTREQKLTVTAAQQATQAGDFAFAEIRLGKKKPYVGEAISIEMRLFLDASARWELTRKPLLSGNGFTLQPFAGGTQRPVELAGKNYIEATFRSVIIPGKAGKITVGPLPVKTVYSSEGRRRRDPFSMFSQPGNVQELDVVAPAIEMEAQLLPSEGRPADFSGAIGKFEFQAVGTPNRVNVGEPVQMVLKVTGDGNFDRISVPAIVDPNGWNAYEAKTEFEPSDEQGFSGTKTFTLPVAPTTRKTAMPVFAFTYFDPETAKYREIKSTASPLAVTGAEAAPPIQPPAPIPAKEPTPAAPTPEPAAAQDILGILPPGGLALSPGPSLRNLYLLLAAPVPVLAGLVYWRRRAGDARARRAQNLKREKSQAMQKVQSVSRSEELYEAAIRVLQFDAALLTGKEAHACDMADILSSRQVDEPTAKSIEELFNSRAAFAYAGGTRSDSALRESERDRVLEIISSFERSKTR